MRFLGLETKDVIIHGTESSMHLFELVFFAPWNSIATAQRGSDQVDATHVGDLCRSWEIFEFGEPESFIMGCMETCLTFFPEEAYLFILDSKQTYPQEGDIVFQDSSPLNTSMKR